MSLYVTGPGGMAAAAPPPFTPLSLTGLGGWWDASVFASMTFSGSDVIAMADQSGAGNNITTTAGTNAPKYDATGLNGKPSMDFSQTGPASLGNLSFPLGTGNTLTAFFVGWFTTAFSTANAPAISYSGGPNPGVPITGTNDMDNNQSFFLGQESTGNNVVLYRNASIADRNFPGDGTPHRCIATVDSSGIMTIYVDGIATVGNTLNATWGSPGQLSIGNVGTRAVNAHWHGELSEIGLATGFSSSLTVASLDSYLKTKWGL